MKAKMVYVTKNALINGIEYLQVLETLSPYYVKENVKYGRDFHKGDWFENKDDAIANAEERRMKKLQSLDNQIKKISKLIFQ